MASGRSQAVAPNQSATATIQAAHSYRAHADGAARARRADAQVVVSAGVVRIVIAEGPRRGVEVRGES